MYLYPLTNNDHTIQIFDSHYIASQLDKQTVSCSTLDWEFTAKLVFSSDISYQLSTYQCIKEHNKNNKK